MSNIAAVTDARGVSIGIYEMFSNAGGSVQYVLLSTFGSGLAAGTVLTVSDEKGTRSVALPHPLPPEPRNQSFLVATETFASLRLIQPDFVIPDGFLPIRKGSISIGGATLNYDELMKVIETCAKQKLADGKARLTKLSFIELPTKEK